MLLVSSLKEKACREGGFTLIEVLVALTIFAIGLLALAGMQVTGIKGNSRAQSVTAKVALADGVVEEILARSGDDAIFSIGVATNYDPWTSVALAGAGTCEADVTLTPNYIFADLLQVVVSVNDANGVGQPVVRTVVKRRY